MPSKTISRAATRTTRTNSLQKQRAKRNGCKASNGAATKAPRILAHSFHSLKLTARTGVEVAMTVAGTMPDGLHLGDMYGDLVAIYARLQQLLNGEKTSYNPLALGFPMHQALPMIVTALKNFTPAGWSSSIQKNSMREEYLFVIYKDCDFQCAWHYFPVKPIVNKLKRNKRLLEVYLEFIKKFSSSCKIDKWSQHGLGYAEMMYVEDKLENLHEYWDNEDDIAAETTVIKDAIASYQCGEAYEWMRRINNAELLTDDALLAKIKSCKKSALRDWMLETMKAVSSIFNTGHYSPDYDFGEFSSDDQVWLRDQVIIVWEVEDVFFNEQAEYLDAMVSNAGITEPIAYIEFSKSAGKQEKLLYNNSTEMEQWPSLIEKAFQTYPA